MTGGVRNPGWPDLRCALLPVDARLSGVAVAGMHCRGVGSNTRAPNNERTISQSKKSFKDSKSDEVALELPDGGQGLMVIGWS